MIDKLLVIIPDKLSEIIKKGEIVPRYYNPGNIFDEVHIMMINDDKPNPLLVQPMVGTAKLYLYNHPVPKNFLKVTMGYQNILIKNWCNNAYEIISSIIKPNIVRCYGMHLNLAIGNFIKTKSRIPFLVSLHAHPYLDSHKESLNVKEKIRKYFDIKLSRYLKHADLILPVYIGIKDFLKNITVSNYQVLYNTVGVSAQNIKRDWNFTGNFKCLCVGQQIANKNPENLIKSLAITKGVTLDIVGTGYLNNYLKSLTHKLSIENKVKFIDSISHLQLCNKLKEYDCLATNIDCIGISKTILEAFLSKLPVLINLNSCKQVPELNDEICYRVPDSVDGYKNGIKNLMSSNEKRKELAENAYKVAIQKWSPVITEKQHMNIYRNFLHD